MSDLKKIKDQFLLKLKKNLNLSEINSDQNLESIWKKWINFISI